MLNEVMRLGFILEAKINRDLMIDRYFIPHQSLIKPMSNVLNLRDAKPEDAAIVSHLAIRSKAYWGYSEDFMESCRQELTIIPDQIQDPQFHFVVAETIDKIVGFYGVEQLSPIQFELEALFVKPEYMGLGIGRALITNAKDYVAACGGKSLIIQGDPHAEGFYRTVGATRIGERESSSIPGRFLPIFWLEVGFTPKS